MFVGFRDGHLKCQKQYQKLHSTGRIFNPNNRALSNLKMATLVAILCKDIDNRFIFTAIFALSEKIYLIFHNENLP